MAPHQPAHVPRFGHLDLAGLQPFIQREKLPGLVRSRGHDWKHRQIAMPDRGQHLVVGRPDHLARPGVVLGPNHQTHHNCQNRRAQEHLDFHRRPPGAKPHPSDRAHPILRAPFASLVARGTGISLFLASKKVSSIARNGHFRMDRATQSVANLAGELPPELKGIAADLYGTITKEGKRISKLASYTGRSSLEGWLRTVMAQEHVNRFRRQKRTISLDEETEEGQQFAAPAPEPAAPVDPRLESATDEALAALPADERFILAAYYLDGRTLAEIARTLSVHESTISRKVDKLAKSLRKQILAGLARRGLSRRQAEEALEVDVRDMALNIRGRLAQDSPRSAFPEKKVEAPAGDGSG